MPASHLANAIRPVWGERNEARLRELWNGGVKTVLISKQMGRSKSSIVGKAHRMHLESRVSPIQRRDDPDRPRVAGRGKLGRPPMHESLAMPKLPPPPDDMDFPVPQKPVFRAPQPVPNWMAQPVGHARRCQFPLWNSKGPVPRPALFCGKPSVVTSWCREHALLVFQSPASHH